MLRSFFNEDFSKKLFFHNDLNSFYEKVPKAALPYEYGGEAGAVDEIAGPKKNFSLKMNCRFH